MNLRRAAALLLAGLALLAGAARHATADVGPTAADRAGGVLHVNLSGSDIASLDPALAYDPASWQLLAATCAKLLNYPDSSGTSGARLRPEVARSMPRTSAGGKTYTFTLRTGYRFNTGAAVTPASFVRAFERALSPKVQSPAASFLGEVAGAAAFARGKAKRIAGLHVSGNTLTIRLTKVAPDFLSRVAMPFFCAVPNDLSLVDSGVQAPPMAGPYYVAARVPNRSVTLRRNPFYRGPRPNRLDEIAVTVNTNQATSFLQIQRGEADYDAAGLSPVAYAAVSRKFGVNRGRYFVHPLMAVSFIALNTRRPLFRDVAMRRAVNFALDRRALTRTGGTHGSSPTDQLLPPNIPGFRDARLYPFSPDLDRARALAGGRTGKAILYAGNLPTDRDAAVLIQYSLRKIGIEVEIKTFPFAVHIAKAGRRGEPFDMDLSGWFADYPDPYNFIDVLLNGRRIQAANNVNTAYFNDPEYNRKIAAAATMSGAARFRAYGALDVDIGRNAAPLVPISNPNVREFVSSRVGCYAFHPVWGSMNLAAVCLR